MDSLTPDEVRSLLEELTALRNEVRELREENVKLHEENTRLRERLGMTPRNSSLPPSTEHPHAKPKPNGCKRTRRKRGGQKGHQRNQRDLIPTEQCDAVHEIKPTTCDRCGEKLAGEVPLPSGIR